MRVQTKNEYGRLKSVILGRANNANWPKDDLFFNRMESLSTFPKKIQRGPVAQTVIDEANNDLLYMKDVLEDHNVKVYRPEIVNYRRSETFYGSVVQGMHSYSARDLLLSIGNMVIECPTPFTSRNAEFQAFDIIKQEAMKNGCRWIAAPRARMEPKECVIKSMPSRIALTEKYPIFDAANILKFNDKLLYLVSSTANIAGAKWLQSVVGTEFEVIVWNKVYTHAHIDSTLISLNDDTILINASRVKNIDKLPKFLRGHKKLWVHDCIPGPYYEVPYSSKWIGMNLLSLDHETVMIDPIQKDLISQLTNEGFRCLKVPLRHSRTLGGGHHCVTCDLERD